MVYMSVNETVKSALLGKSCCVDIVERKAIQAIVAFCYAGRVWVFTILENVQLDYCTTRFGHGMLPVNCENMLKHRLAFPGSQGVDCFISRDQGARHVTARSLSQAPVTVVVDDLNALPSTAIDTKRIALNGSSDLSEALPALSAESPSTPKSVKTRVSFKVSCDEQQSTEVNSEVTNCARGNDPMQVHAVMAQSKVNDVASQCKHRFQDLRENTEIVARVTEQKIPPSKARSNVFPRGIPLITLPMPQYQLRHPLQDYHGRPVQKSRFG